jgi:hypothetical protein
MESQVKSLCLRLGFGVGFGLTEEVTLDVSSSPSVDERRLISLIVQLRRIRVQIGEQSLPIREDEESVVLRPIHPADKSSLVRPAHPQALEDVARAGESLEPDNAMELDLPLCLELEQRVKGEVSGGGFFERVVGRRRVDSHRRDSSDSEGDAKDGEDGFAEVGEGWGRVGGVGVEHGNEDVAGSQSDQPNE